MGETIQSIVLLFYLATAFYDGVRVVISHQMFITELADKGCHPHAFKAKVSQYKVVWRPKR